jgi:hypothetical protein
MPLQDLLQMLRRQPFQPFRVHVTDGSSYDVRHPELCMAGARSVLIGLPAAGSAEPVYDRYVNIDLVHITRLEPVQPATQSGDGQAG